jgi:dephospho-CoA kinase
VNTVKDKRPFILGLTGSIASGKSEASKYLAKRYFIIDCDKLVAQIYERPSFKEILLSNFGVDNKKDFMSNLNFDKRKIKRLNELIHPLVFESIEELINNNLDQKIIVVDIPLLFETNYDLRVDYILMISASYNKQLTRLKSRQGWNEDTSRFWISLQLSTKLKRSKSTWVIHNNYSLAYLHHQLDIAMTQLEKNLI